MNTATGPKRYTLEQIVAAVLVSAGAVFAGIGAGGVIKGELNEYRFEQTCQEKGGYVIDTSRVDYRSPTRDTYTDDALTCTIDYDEARDNVATGYSVSPK